ncbi:MAG: polysaccharide pyruvyl transferase family protein [Phycisphaerales bacterium]|nr:MAG: polysaccharide pyruvyl transferase family protein [Phycisphaerales bacterium]
MPSNQHRSAGHGAETPVTARDSHSTGSSSLSFPGDCPAPGSEAPRFGSDRSLKLCVFGAAPGTGNLGVSALSLSLLGGIARRVKCPLITTFDNSPGLRTDHVRIGGHDLAYQLCGMIPTRRLYHPDSLWRIRLAGRLGGLGNLAIKAIREADAVLDLTGGDSFTDLYGRRRFRIVTLEKIIALQQKRPLILPPQTIGPFNHARSRRIAQRILRAATMVWARDQKSFTILRELLGCDFDTHRHRCGIDIAFGLETNEPARPLPEPIASWLSPDRSRPVVGFNVSGLISNNPDQSKRRFNLRADYHQAVVRFLRRILDETDCNVLLVPHVSTAPGHFEHDPDACKSAAAELGRTHRRRVQVLPDCYDACETKWVIARTDWFCGTRMHAAIAALSSGVPSAAIAYTRKTLGVFQTCGQGRHVADPRETDTDDIVEHLWRSFNERAEAEVSLQRELPTIRWQVETQMDQILGCCASAEQFGSGLRKAA